MKYEEACDNFDRVQGEPSMWKVVVTKQDILLTKTLLVPSKNLYEAVKECTQLFNNWNPNTDSIVLTPTDMEYYG